MKKAKESGVDERSRVVHRGPLHPEVAGRKTHIDSDGFIMVRLVRTGFAMEPDALFPPGCDSTGVRFLSAALVHQNAPPLAV